MEQVAVSLAAVRSRVMVIRLNMRMKGVILGNIFAVVQCDSNLARQTCVVAFCVHHVTGWYEALMEFAEGLMSTDWCAIGAARTTTALLRLRMLIVRLARLVRLKSSKSRMIFDGHTEICETKTEN